MSMHDDEMQLSRESARKQKKRQQNLTNQRARRARLRQQKEEIGNVQANAYVVRQWRLQFEPVAPQPPNQVVVVHAQSNASSSSEVDQVLDSVAQPPSARPASLPWADMLFSLVQHNVYRALLYNKYTLGRSATTFHQRQGDFFWHRTPCHGASVVVPLSPQIPDALAPTRLQMDVPHSPWINMIPFPQMRDNLIRWEAGFDHADFLYDLIGISYCLPGGDYEYAAPRLSIPRKAWLALDEEDQGTAGMQGLVISGEAYRKDSWELTAAFVAKWTWVVDGCEEILEISNRWRKSRGEGPLRLVPIEA